MIRSLILVVFLALGFSSMAFAQAPSFAGNWRLELNLQTGGSQAGDVTQMVQHVTDFTLPVPMLVLLSTTVSPTGQLPITSMKTIYDSTTGIGSPIPGGYVQVYSLSDEPGIYNIRVVYPTRDGVYKAELQVLGNSTRIASPSAQVFGSIQGNLIPPTLVEPTRFLFGYARLARR